MRKRRRHFQLAETSTALFPNSGLRFSGVHCPVTQFTNLLNLPNLCPVVPVPSVLRSPFLESCPGEARDQYSI